MMMHFFSFIDKQFAQEIWDIDDDALLSEDGEKCGPRFWSKRIKSKMGSDSKIRIFATKKSDILVKSDDWREMVNCYPDV